MNQASDPIKEAMYLEWLQQQNPQTAHTVFTQEDAYLYADLKYTQPQFNKLFLGAFLSITLLSCSKAYRKNAIIDKWVLRTGAFSLSTIGYFWAKYRNAGMVRKNALSWYTRHARPY